MNWKMKKTNRWHFNKWRLADDNSQDTCHPSSFAVAPGTGRGWQNIYVSVVSKLKLSLQSHKSIKSWVSINVSCIDIIMCYDERTASYHQ